MAGYIGRATEALAEHTGPKIGGLLNATLGNAAELIITLVAIRSGLVELVKASITGSILGNLLLVLGFSMFAGGIKHHVQHFDRHQAANNSTLLIMIVLTMGIPSLFSHSIGAEGSWAVESLSLGVAIIMILLYVLGLAYSLRVAHSPLSQSLEPKALRPTWSVGFALLVLVLSTAGIAWLSELLVGSVEAVVVDLGWSEFFLGIILIPIVGNVAEHLVAVQSALRNQMDLSVEIAISSSLQIALFVAPLLVLISLWIGHPLTLVFNPLELLALLSGVIIAAMVSVDGESNWLEGAALLGVYLILAWSFFLVPV